MYTLHILHPSREIGISTVDAPDLRRLISAALTVFVEPGVLAVAITRYPGGPALWWLDVTFTHPDTPNDEVFDPDDWADYSDPL